jgi:hypothetical protein
MRQLSARVMTIKIVLIFLAAVMILPVFVIAAWPFLSGQAGSVAPGRELPQAGAEDFRLIYESLGRALTLLIPGSVLLVAGIWFGSGVRFAAWGMWKNPLVISGLFLIFGVGGVIWGVPEAHPLWLGMVSGGLFGFMIGWIFYVFDRRGFFYLK